MAAITGGGLRTTCSDTGPEDCLSGLVTTTARAPIGAVSEAVAANWIWVAETTVAESTETSPPLIESEAPGRKFCPVRVNWPDVPCWMLDGSRAIATGGGGAVTITENVTRTTGCPLALDPTSVPVYVPGAAPLPSANGNVSGGNDGAVVVWVPPVAMNAGRPVNA